MKHMQEIRNNQEKKIHGTWNQKEPARFLTFALLIVYEI